jgi:hypothetical protein
MARQCQHCNANLSAKELEEGWCESCGKEIGRSGGRPAPEAAPASEPARRSSSFGSCFAVLLSLLALVIAVVALVMAVFHDPLGPIYQFHLNPFRGDLGGYDLSSPAEAYKAELRMQKDGDLRAGIAMQRKLREAELKEQLESLKIDREESVKLPELGPRAGGKGKGSGSRDVTILFVTYKKKGELQHHAVAMEKDSESGLWRDGFVSYIEVEPVNATLAKSMREWEEKDKNLGGDEKPDH